MPWMKGRTPVTGFGAPHWSHQTLVCWLSVVEPFLCPVVKGLVPVLMSINDTFVFCELRCTLTNQELSVYSVVVESLCFFLFFCRGVNFSVHIFATLPPWTLSFDSIVTRVYIVNSLLCNCISFVFARHGIVDSICTTSCVCWKNKILHMSSRWEQKPDFWGAKWSPQKDLIFFFNPQKK